MNFRKRLGWRLAALAAVSVITMALGSCQGPGSDAEQTLD